MSELVSEFVKNANIVQLFAIGIMFWFFYNRMDAKITTIKQDLMEKIDKVDVRIDKVDAKIDKVDAKIEATKQELIGKIDILANKVEDVDRRLCRIEGSLATQGHYLFGQKEYDRKAE